MTITTTTCVQNGCLMVRGKVVLTGVPNNVVVSPGSSASAFLGATSTLASSRHVFTLGVLEGFRLLCLFRAKIWWMIPHYGKSGGEIPMETQMLLLEAREESIVDDDISSDPSSSENTFYILFLPVLDGEFRTSLQGTPANELQFCVESGDANVQTLQTLEPVFINSGDNPFELIKESIKILAEHKGTFSHIESKKIPAHLEGLGGVLGMLFTLKLIQKASKRVFKVSLMEVVHQSF
ncbi:hypothetical protein SLEP1_g13245 [Rubroshorea leprosula]|uniref:Uncharacterized protein n=1 Tax=Rubroshorea leprosula TaxID=152421 RepID=A0AAV5IF71_9ROSI|nr:hypothetical protein SLEP1_g13245 [Rubroshorea leprosula]